MTATHSMTCPKPLSAIEPEGARLVGARALRAEGEPEGDDADDDVEHAVDGVADACRGLESRVVAGAP